jgi:hypothetical protein
MACVERHSDGTCGTVTSILAMLSQGTVCASRWQFEQRALAMGSFMLIPNKPRAALMPSTKCPRDDTPHLRHIARELFQMYMAMRRIDHIIESDLEKSSASQTNCWEIVSDSGQRWPLQLSSARNRRSQLPLPLQVLSAKPPIVWSPAPILAGLAHVSRRATGCVFAENHFVMLTALRTARKYCGFHCCLSMGRSGRAAH